MLRLQSYVREVTIHFLEWVHVYVGRNMTVYVPGTVASPLANPYSAKQFGCRECRLNYLKDRQI